MENIMTMTQPTTQPTIFNGTVHGINLYQKDDVYPIQGGRKHVKKDNAKPVTIISPGVNLNAVKENKAAPEIQGRLYLY